MTNEIIIPQEVKTLTNTVKGNVEFYRSDQFTIKTAEQYTSSAEDLKRVHAQEKEIKERKAGMTRPLNATKDAIMSFFRIPERYCAEIKAAISEKRVGYQKEQNRIRREEEDRIRKLQEAEAKKLERRAANVKTEEKAEELRQEAEQIRETAPTVSVGAIEKSQGIRTVTSYKFTIIDPSKIPAEYLIPDEQKIGRVIRATRGEVSIPGVKNYTETKESSTGR